MSTPIGLAIIKPHFYDSGDDVLWLWINWRNYRDFVGTAITGEEELDIFLLELARHFPEANISFKFDRRHKLMLELQVVTEKRTLSYPYWKIPAASPLARFFPVIVAIVHTDGVDRRMDFDPSDNICYKSLSVINSIKK